MNSSIAPAHSSSAGAPRMSTTGWALIGGAILCLVAGGGLLWWQNGAAVFSDVVLAALAWCF